MSNPTLIDRRSAMPVTLRRRPWRDYQGQWIQYLYGTTLAPEPPEPPEVIEYVFRDVLIVPLTRKRQPQLGFIQSLLETTLAPVVVVEGVAFRMITPAPLTGIGSGNRFFGDKL